MSGAANVCPVVRVCPRVKSVLRKQSGGTERESEGFQWKFSRLASSPA